MTKPSYLGLLNAIAVGEVGGEALFAAWEAATPDDELRALFHTVALREGEHARSFAKRLDELGFGVRERPDPDLPARLAIAADPDLDDVAKFEQLGFHREPAQPDVFAGMFADPTIDPVTGTLLGRYVCEERDTARRLAAAYRDRTETTGPAGADTR